MTFENIGVKIFDPVEVKPNSSWAEGHSFIVDRQDLAFTLQIFSRLKPTRLKPSITQTLHIRPGELFPQNETFNISCDTAAVSKLIRTEYRNVTEYVALRRLTDPSFPDLTLKDYYEIFFAKNEAIPLPETPAFRRIIAKAILKSEIY